eukprot:9125789-Prorocentrum_lima.AAC.1
MAQSKFSGVMSERLNCGSSDRTGGVGISIGTLCDCQCAFSKYAAFVSAMASIGTCCLCSPILRVKGVGLWSAVSSLI